MGIINKDGALWMATGVDNSGLYSGFNQAENRVDQFEAHIKRMGDNITRLTGIGFGVAGLKAFGSEIINVRGEMQLLETSFSVLLGNQAKANAMLSEIKEYNIQSPLSLNGISQGAQLLLGFNVEAEKVMPTLKQLGDISMGDTGRFQSLALAFAQMSAAGKLMGQDLLQMINAGFNPLQEISRNTGKSLNDLRKDMENGSISSQMVADAFASATTEGGKFYGMTEKQAEGIKGLQAKLEGGLIDAFNKVGKSQEGLIVSGYKVSIALVENYQAVGEALTALIATYGVYKAAMVFNTSIDKTVTIMRYEAEIVELTKLLPLKGQEANADLKAAVASGKLTEEKAKQLIALRAEIESRRESIQSKLTEEQANLKALYAKRTEAKEALELARAKTAAAKDELSNAIIAAQGEVEASLQKKMAIESEKQSRAALRIVRLQEQKDTAITQATALKEQSASAEKIAAKNREIASIQAKIVAAREEEIQHGRNVAAARAEIKAGVNVATNKSIQTLTNKVNTLSEQENTAAVTHNGLIKQTVAGKVLIKKIATDADTASTQINTAVTNANTTSTNFLAVAKNRAAVAAKNLWAAIAPNPYVLAAAAVVALGYGVYKLVTATSTQETAQKALNKVLDEAKQKKDDLSGKTDDLIGIVNSETKTVFDQIEAYQKLQGLYPKYLAGMSRQEFQAMSLTEQQKLLNKALSEFDISNKDAILEQYRSLYAEIQRIKETGNGYSYDSVISDATGALDISFWTRLKMNGADIEELLQQHIRSLEEQKKQREENLKQAQFEALSEEEKKKIYKEQLSFLEKQKSLIESQIPNVNGINTAWNKLNPTFILLNNQLGDILSKIADTRAKLEDKPTSKNKSFWEKEEKDAKDALALMDESAKGSAEWKKQLDKLNTSKVKLGIWDFSGKSQKSTESAAQKMRDAYLKALNTQAELDNESVKQQLDHEQKLLDIEQDSFDKRYRQNQLNAAKELVAIEEYRQKMAKAQQDAARNIYESNTGSSKGFNFATFDKSLLPDGLKDSDIDAQVKNMTDAIVAAYKKGNEDLAKEQKAFADEERLTFASQLDQQIYSIRAHYKQRRIEAENNAEDIKLINDNENREIIAARLQAQKKQLEVDTAYNQKVVEILNDRYAFEADKRKAALEQQIKDQEVLIENIKEQLTNDPNNIDLANELEDAKIQLILFNKELNKTKVNKFSEMASAAADISSSLRGALDDFGTEFSDDVNKTLDGFEQILSGAGQLAEGLAEKNPAKIIQGAIEQTRGYFNAISGILGTADYSGYEKLKSKYDNLLDIWDELIEKKKKYLSESVADEVVRVEKEALDLINKQTDAVKKLAEARLKAGSSAGSHSLWYRMWKGSYKFDGKNWRDVAGDIEKELGVSFTKMEDMLNMSADQLQWIKENYSGLWTVMDGDFRGYLEQLIAYGDQAQEIIDQAKESLTGVSFDNMKDSFLNTLLDMSSDAEDFTDDFVSYFQKAIMQRMLDNQFADRLQSFYDSFAEANKENGIDSSEYNKLQNEWNNIVNDALAQRDSLKDIFGWTDTTSTSQSSSKGSFETITQDQAGEMNGRLTGIHETDIRIEQNTLQLILLASERNTILKGYSEGFQAIRNVLVETRFILEEMRDSNNELYEIKDTLIEIKKNTKGLVTK